MHTDCAKNLQSLNPGMMIIGQMFKGQPEREAAAQTRGDRSDNDHDILECELANIWFRIA
jgi:hypothetical protein